MVDGSTNLRHDIPRAGASSRDFVRKIFNMLEDSDYEETVRWSVDGKSFVVLDPSEFTKEVLPRHFKHSNFASFIRQLNKYDFHKVRSGPNEPSYYGENAWEFRHPDFQRNRRDQLDNIKRKTPNKKNADARANTDSQSSSSQQATAENYEHYTTLTNEMNKLQESHRKLIYSMEDLKQENRYALRSIDHFRGLMINRNDYLRETLNLLALSNTPQSRQFQSLLQSLNESMTENAPLDGMTELRAAQIPQQHMNHVDQTVMPHLPHELPMPAYSASPPIPQQHIQQQQHHHHPPPFRILLGEEDGLVARLCSKFINQFGNCILDIAADGLEAVRYFQTPGNHYDLILVDSILPSLDGVSVAEIVRRGDTEIPIFMMSPKVEPDVMNSYLQRGINEILVKPFSKTFLQQKMGVYLKGYDNGQSSKRTRID